ncbi:MAG: hypothetical protein AAF636_18685 [Pseudomonadota bacterium]
MANLKTLETEGVMPSVVEALRAKREQGLIGNDPELSEALGIMYGGLKALELLEAHGARLNFFKTAKESELLAREYIVRTVLDVADDAAIMAGARIIDETKLVIDTLAHLPSAPHGLQFDENPIESAYSEISKKIGEVFESLTNNYGVFPHNDNVRDENVTSDRVSEAYNNESAKERWDEDLRNNSRIQLRISAQLREEIDRAALEDWLDRSAWFTRQARIFLNLSGDSVPEEYPDYRSDGVINLRIPTDLDEELSLRAAKGGIKKPELVRRLIHHSLEAREAQPNPNLSR